MDQLLKAAKLRVEFLNNPLGIDVTAPRLGWINESDRRGVKQSAYRIIAASSLDLLNQEQGDLWDTGKVSSDESQHIAYAGSKLVSEQLVYWKVQVWDEHGQAGNWSEAAHWSMGLLGREEWKGLWIGWKNNLTPTREQTKPNIYMRRSFTVKPGIKRATVYTTALGLYRLFLNGQRVGQDVLSPEWTDYHVRVMYQTYDVTDLLQAGDNVAGTILSHGWYTGYLGMFGFLKYGMNPSYLMQLNIEYEDGTNESVVTDNEWQAAHGPIVTSDIQMGEHIDARQEMPGWNAPGFDASAWVPVDAMYDYRGWIVAQMNEKIRVTEELKPVNIRHLSGDRVVIDFGQNFAGWIRASFKGAADRTYTFRHAEVLDDNGDIYTENLRYALQTDKYTCKGSDLEVFEPSFTYHGFQYVEISGGPIDLVDVIGVVAHSSLQESGTLTTSHAKVNRLVQNVRWTQRANFMGVPTDCPQRDERHGWTGDAQIFSGTAVYNMDSAAFFTKWLVDLEDAQQPTGSFTDFAPFIFGPKTAHGSDFTYTHMGSAGWADAPLIVAWKMYESYGDKWILSRHYDAFKRWVDFNAKQQPEGVRRDVPQYGDWLSVMERPMEEAIAEFGRMISHLSTTPYDIYATAYMADSARHLSQIAEVLGKNEDAAKYHARFEVIRDAFVKNFVAADGRIKSDTQTAYAMALGLDLLPEEMRPIVVDRLVGKIREKGDMATTGFHGTMFLMKVLVEEGHTDLAYKLLLREEYPSWLYSVNQGATTIWERWDGYTKEKGFQRAGMNSMCHFAFGSVGEWMFRNIGGIDRDDSATGYRKSVIRPRIEGGITSAKCGYDSIYGQVSTDWSVEEGKFSLALNIPANTTATVYVPSAEGAVVLESGGPAADAYGVALVGYEDGCYVYTVGAGAYRFESSL